MEKKVVTDKYEHHLDTIKENDCVSNGLEAKALLYAFVDNIKTTEEAIDALLALGLIEAPSKVN